jgi:hypothetical protein
MSEEVPHHIQLMKLIVGKWFSKPVYAAAELGIADLLSDGPMEITELADKCDAHAPSLYRVMRALASVGIFRELDDGRFDLTPMAELLKSGAMRPLARMFSASWNDRAWMHFLDGVQSGKTPFVTAHGRPLFQWLEENPRAAEVLMESNAFKAATTHRAIVDAYDFSGIDTLVDVGGGNVSLMVEVLSAFPDMKGIVADVPAMIAKADESIRRHSLETRCKAIECDFFGSVPPSGDVYLLSNILHDWDDEHCGKILDACSAVQQPGGKLLIVEAIVPPGNEPSVSKLLDLEMFVITGGMERTESEYRELLESSGYGVSRVIPTGESISIIEAIRS